MIGWNCPLCGRAYSPHVCECKNCNEKVSKKERMKKIGNEPDDKPKGKPVMLNEKDLNERD